MAMIEIKTRIHVDFPRLWMLKLVMFYGAKDT